MTSSAHPAETLPKWWCQKEGATSGMTAIDSRMPANGTIQSRFRWRPSIAGAPGPAARAGRADIATATTSVAARA